MTDDRLDRLESLVEDQQETIERQRERLDRLETERADAEGEAAEEGSGDADRSSSAVSRRGILHGLGVAGLVGLGAGTASADEPRGVVGSGDHPVDTLYLDTLSGTLTGGTDLTTLTGGGLAIEDGALEASSTGPTVSDFGRIVAEDVDRLNFEDNLDVREGDDGIEVTASDSNSQTDVSDSGTTVVSSTSDVDFGDNLDVTDDGDGSATVDADVQAATNWEDAGSNLLTTSSPFTGISVDDLEVGSLVFTGSTTIDHADLDGVSADQHHAEDHDHTEADVSAVPNGGLSNESVTVAGNSVSLGGSTGVSHGDLDAVDQIAGSNLHASGGALNVDSQLDLGDSPSLTMGDFTFDSPTSNLLELTHGIPAFFAPDASSTIDLGMDSQRWNTVYCESVDESSDARLKEDVADLGDGLERLDCIRPVSYQWKDADDPERRLGFVAQELDDAVPEAVSRPDDEDSHLGINNTMVTAVAVSAIQDQQELIEDLDEECADLRSENEAFREQCADLETRLAAVEDKLSTEGTSQAVADD